MLLPSTALVPLGIFIAEMCVVTIGTLRIIFIARGRRLLAPILGFFEILIWLFAIGQTMQNLNNGWCFGAFALGFTTGNFLGMFIERKLAMGLVIARIFTHGDAKDLTAELRAASFGYTCVDGLGATGPVRIVMAVVKRRQLGELLRLIEARQPRAFYAIDDVQTATRGIFPESEARSGGRFPSAFLDVLSRFKATPAGAARAYDVDGSMMAAIHEQAENSCQGDGQPSQAA